MIKVNMFRSIALFFWHVKSKKFHNLPDDVLLPDVNITHQFKK